MKKKITNHYYNHGCCKDCPYNHTDVPCQHMDEDFMTCGKYELEHDK